MRLAPAHVELIRRTALQVLGEHAQVVLFGSRVDDAALGGDVDLLVTVPHAVDEPAVLSARMASSISRAMGGRKVDVVLQAPNLLPQAIALVARQTGVRL